VPGLISRREGRRLLTVHAEERDLGEYV